MKNIKHFNKKNVLEAVIRASLLDNPNAIISDCAITEVVESALSSKVCR